jgi:hypothetical protein
MKATVRGAYAFEEIRLHHLFPVDLWSENKTAHTHHPDVQVLLTQLTPVTLGGRLTEMNFASIRMMSRVTLNVTERTTKIVRVLLPVNVTRNLYMSVSVNVNTTTLRVKSSASLITGDHLAGV